MFTGCHAVIGKYALAMVKFKNKMSYLTFGRRRKKCKRGSRALMQGKVEGKGRGLANILLVVFIIFTKPNAAIQG